MLQVYDCMLYQYKKQWITVSWEHLIYKLVDILAAHDSLAEEHSVTWW